MHWFECMCISPCAAVAWGWVMLFLTEPGRLAVSCRANRRVALSYRAQWPMSHSSQLKWCLHCLHPVEDAHRVCVSMYMNMQSTLASRLGGVGNMVTPSQRQNCCQTIASGFWDCVQWLINAFCESLKHVLFVYFPFTCWQSSSSFSSSPPFLSDCCVSWHLHATCRSAEKCETVGRNVHLIARVLTNKRHGDRTQSKTRRAFKFGIYLRWGDRSTTLTLHSRELLWTDNM